jgi:hypothetical protein
MEEFKIRLSDESWDSLFNNNDNMDVDSVIVKDSFIYLVRIVTISTEYYKQYCKILARIITEVKRSKYNNQIINSTNKMKTMWNK